ncbi:MAG: 50S ribosomal protein L21 [Candidatus Shikimatogenerans sp. JK-2022]|nr:50S ribosomal protein L21 [Candidatus Shikimatogenerans bostrichidophilus]
MKFKFKKAIILIKNNQYLVYPNKITYINKLNNNTNNILYINKILYIIDNNNKIYIGNPLLNNFIIKILIINNIKDKKIIIFKKKKRKGYKKKIGYRKIFTKIKIINIKFNKNGT